jgi:hypothetical protein
VLPFCSFPPGWPLLISVPLALADPGDPLVPLRVAQVLNVLLGVALGGLTWVVVRRAAGEVAALVALLLISALPLGILLSTGAMSDLCHAVALVAAWWCLDRRRELAAGLILGYAYVVRPEALAILVVLLADLAWRERRAPWRLAAGAAVGIVPYLVFARVSLGHWSLSSKTGFLTAAVDQGLGGLLAENIPAVVLALPGLLGWPVAALAVLGLAVRPGRWALFLVPILLVPLFPFRMDPRYWVPYLPFVLLAAGLGAGWLAGRVGPARRRSLTAGLVAVVLVGFLAGSGRDLPRVSEEREVYIGLRDTGFWLGERVGHDTIVAAYKPYASYWGWCRFASVARASTAAEVVAVARRRGARYLVINRHIARFLHPPLGAFTRPLPAELAAQVRPVHVLEYPELPGHDTIIYEVLDPAPPAANPWRTFWVQAPERGR